MRDVPPMSSRLRQAMPGGLGMTAIEAALLSEIEGLSQTIAGAKSEIAAIHSDAITADHIPVAQDELDAIIDHTARATETILEACETLDELGAGLPSCQANRLQDATMRIYEACSFQDITGQRITKVVAALKAIEEKVDGLTTAYRPVAKGAAWSEQPTGGAARPDPGLAAPSLLNGPQLPAAAMGQDEIDRLLAGA